jgi:hypothetical protein
VLLISSLSHRANANTISRRRNQIIYELRRMLLDPVKHPLPDTAVAISTLMAAEWRAGEVGAVAFHAKGLKAWIDTQGGLGELDRRFNHFTVMSLLSICIHCSVPIFDSETALDEALLRFWLPFFDPDPLPENMRKYAYVHHIGSQIAVLYVLSMLKLLGLEKVISDIASRLPPTRSLPSGSMMYTVMAAVEPVRGSGFRYEVLSTQRIIEFVFLLAHLSCEKRENVLQRLADQLTGESPGGGYGIDLEGCPAPRQQLNWLDQQYQADIKHQVRTAWLLTSQGKLNSDMHSMDLDMLSPSAIRDVTDFGVHGGEMSAATSSHSDFSAVEPASQSIRASMSTPGHGSGTIFKRGLHAASRRGMMPPGHPAGLQGRCPYSHARGTWSS